MNNKLLIGVVVSLLFCEAIIAAEHTIDTAQIVEIDAEGKRPSFPEYENNNYIKFSGPVWDNGTCRENWGLLQNKSQLSIAMTAFVSGKNVLIQIDDEISTRVDGSYCMVTSLVLKN